MNETLNDALNGTMKRIFTCLPSLKFKTRVQKQEMVAYQAQEAQIQEEVQAQAQMQAQEPEVLCTIYQFQNGQVWKAYEL